MHSGRTDYATTKLGSWKLMAICYLPVRGLRDVHPRRAKGNEQNLARMKELPCFQEPCVDILQTFVPIPAIEAGVVVEGKIPVIVVPQIVYAVRGPSE